LRRFAADHGDDALPLGIIQQRFRPGPLPVIEGAVQATAAVAVSDLADGLRSERKRLRDPGRGASLGELPEGQCA
jgi:hypothetical protein